MILLCILVIVVFILFFPIKIAVVVNANTKKYTVDFRIYNIPFGKKQNKSLKRKRPKKQFIDIRKVIKAFMKLRYKPRTSVVYFLDYGFDDAALDATIFGYINIMSSLFHQYIKRYVNLVKFKSHITPIFNNKVFKFYFEGIFKVNLVQIIYVLLKIKYKGGE